LDMGYSAPEWQIPDNIEQVEVDAISGYPAHSDFPTKFDYAIRGTLPALPDPIHRLVEVCKGENDKLATEAKIAAGDYDRREFIFAFEEDPFSEDGENRWQIGINAWIEAQSDSRFRVPTEFCGDLGDVSVRLRRPRDKENFKERSIEVDIRAGSYDGIEKLELYVDDNLLETIVGKSEYQGRINLNPGKYELYAKAYAKNGKSRTSDKVRIGVGGIEWDYVEPTPTPEPTTAPLPTVTPEPELSPIPLPSKEKEKDQTN